MTKILPMAASLQPNLSKADSKLCARLLKEPEIFIHSTITELAKLIGVSNATIVRFTQKFGMDGYQSFKLALAQETSQNDGDKDDLLTGPIEKGDSIEIIAKKFLVINMEALEQTMSLLNYSEVNKAAKMILTAEKVNFMGIGYSGITAQDAKYKFMRIGIDTDAYTDGHTMLMMSAIMHSKDVAFAISHSGNSREVVQSLKIARGNGVKTICVTNSINSDIAEFADALVTYSSTETRFQTGSVATKIAQFFVLDLIYTEVARNSAKYAENKIKTTKALEYLMK
jgi:DNA-binding MurR/RpiR family transcriptional regulator